MLDTYVRGVLDGNAKFAQVAAEFLDAVVVALDGVSGKLLEPTRETLSFGHLAGPDAGPFFIKDVLDLDGENLAKLVKLLGANVRDGIARLELELLEGFLVVSTVEELDDGQVVVTAQFDKDFLPEPLARDLLLVGLPQLHLPHLAVVLDAREHFQRNRLILVEKRSGRRLLRVPPGHVRFPRRRHPRLGLV